MRYLIAGASGFIGQALAAQLFRQGTEVVALVRNPAVSAGRLPGARLHAWDALGGLPPEEAFDGVDVVVNLVGESISKRWNPERKEAFRASRVQGTSALVERMRMLGRRPAAFVSVSGTGIYGARGDEVLTETAPPGAGFLSDMAAAWEAAAEQAAGLGLRTVLLRLGAVLGRGGGILDKLLGPFSLGLGGRLGDGRQFMPWIHLEDAVGLIRFAADHPTLEGPVNAVAPEPITNAEFTSALGEALKRPTLVSLPAFALRLAFGTEMAAELLLSSQRVSPIKALEAGFVFSFPLLREALANLMK